MTTNNEAFAFKSAMAGGLAGMSVDVISFPLDTLKTRVQVTVLETRLVLVKSRLSKRLQTKNICLEVSLPTWLSPFLQPSATSLATILPETYLKNIKI